VYVALPGRTSSKSLYEGDILNYNLGDVFD